ncbi:MAG: NADH-quinone oxidoreductase subunit N [Flavobacterium sp. MedPE-SWcel]|uniref:NADH-quinone oxidoreductase subunit N n=1 Tax=uncultured Flavobacterium sp. TaxID=165435 RepID=UPI0009145F21|nr:NADH-quinone oxidoreductase subunit N [uncultured Flavobacterium sp.]OIQ16000.1 MAG: NADH-quinone oxidoreductase subunit N [Flavobacterium sp. MedPE-SWcel]
MNTLIAIAGLGIICLIAEIFNLRKAIVPVTIIGLLAILGLNVSEYMELGLNTTNMDRSESFYNNMIVNNSYGMAFSGLFIVLTIFLVAMTPEFHKDHKAKLSDFVAIKLFLLTGAIAMVTFGNLAMFFLGIEVLSIALYVLAASNPKDLKSNEAGMKYFLMGAFASGIILFGIALIYGATGSFDVATIYSAVLSGDLPQWFFIGIVMLTIGLLFKIAAAPFHMWAPDVYEGSPALSTATMSTLAKVAAMASFFKLMSSLNHEVSGSYITIISVVAILSMTVGNLMALKQSSVKRMLAFSGISHAGFMLMVFFNPIATEGVLFYYAAAYALAGIAAFAVILYVTADKENEEIHNFNGLGKRNPLMAAVLTCALLSMAGIPIFSGFFAKLFLFTEVINTGHVAIVIIAVANSIISVGYYFKLILAMYTKDATEEAPAKVPMSYSIVAVLAIAINVAVGLYPDALLSLIK